VKPGGWLEQPLLGADFDPQPAAFALHDVDRVPAAGADLIENRLPREAELARGVVELDVPVRDGRHEALSDLVGDPNPPRRMLGSLLGGSSPSESQRRIVCMLTPSSRAASRIDTPEPAGWVRGAAGMFARSRIPATRRR
jgi:hypothetical protein